MESKQKKAIVIVHSYHHMNTERVAAVIAGELGAEVKRPEDITSEALREYELIGFGSGIDSGKHYAPILHLAASLQSAKQKAFIFSTSGVFFKWQMNRNHEALRRILIEKGLTIVDEFGCLGFNTNSFLRFIGGMNKGRPNGDDLKAAAAFAGRLC